MRYDVDRECRRLLLSGCQMLHRQFKATLATIACIATAYYSSAMGAPRLPAGMHVLPEALRVLHKANLATPADTHAHTCHQNNCPANQPIQGIFTSVAPHANDETFPAQASSCRGKISVRPDQASAHHVTQPRLHVIRPCPA